MDPADVGLRLATIVPGQETIVLYLRQAAPPDDVFVAYTIYGARGRPGGVKNDSGSGGIMQVTRKTWHLYRPNLSDAGVPTLSITEGYDYLIDAAGTKWVIESVDAKSQSTFVIVQTYQKV